MSARLLLASGAATALLALPVMAQDASPWSGGAVVEMAGVDGEGGAAGVGLAGQDEIEGGLPWLRLNWATADGGRAWLTGHVSSGQNSRLDLRYVTRDFDGWWVSWQFLRSMRDDATRSPYTWDGGGLMLDATTWSALNTLDPNPVPGGSLDLVSLQAVTGAEPVWRMGVERMRFAAGVRAWFNDFWSGWAEVRWDRRTGWMPRSFYSGTGFKFFTFGPLDPLPWGPDLGVTEVPLRVDDSTLRATAAITGGKSAPLTLTLSALRFDHGSALMTVDHPWLGDPIESLEAPDHNLAEASLTWRARLPGRGFFIADAAWQKVSSDYPLPGFSTGLYQTPVPYPSVDLSTTRWRLHARASWTRPRWALRTSATWASRDPGQDPLDFPAYVSPVFGGPFYDNLLAGFPLGIPRTARWQESDTFMWDVEGRWRPNTRWSLKAGASWKREHHEPRAVERVQTGTWWASVRWRPLDWLNVTVTERWTDVDPGARNPDFYRDTIDPFLNQHPDFTPRDEQTARWRVTEAALWVETGAVTWDVRYRERDGDFPGTVLGRHEAQERRLSAEAVWLLRNGASFSGGWEQNLREGWGWWTHIAGIGETPDPYGYEQPTAYSQSDRDDTFFLHVEWPLLYGHVLTLHGDQTRALGSWMDGVPFESTRSSLDGSWRFKPTARRWQWLLSAGWAERDLFDAYLDNAPAPGEAVRPADEANLFLGASGGEFDGRWIAVSVRVPISR